MIFPNNTPFDDPEHWHSGNSLPHYDGAEVYQCITYRLADSIPQSVLREILAEGDEVRSRREIEVILDRGLGACVLRNPQIAQLILENWFHFHGVRYQIVSYVIMPNHCHILIRVFEEHKLGKIIQSWKIYTAKKIYEIINCDRHVWQLDYWDRFIRDEKHFWDCVNYIHQNPVKAGLCAKPGEWLFSSARFFEKA